jgi:sugar lactone lactonase YvrE
MEGIVFGESPRWHDGRVWFSDWGANQVIALDADGSYQVVVTVLSFPMCIDFLPDGRLLVVDSAQRRVLRREPDGTLAEHARLAGIADKPWNDIVVDGRGNAYVNSIGFEFPGGDGAVWYADVANQHCVRVREGGEVLATVSTDRGAFSCTLSRGVDPRLFVVGQKYGGPGSPEPTGQLVAFPAPAPGAGWP